MILVLDFGSQYTQLIARRVREAHVYCELHPYNLPLEKIRALNPEGIILSGGPAAPACPVSPLASPLAGPSGLPSIFPSTFARPPGKWTAMVLRA